MPGPMRRKQGRSTYLWKRGHRTCRYCECRLHPPHSNSLQRISCDHVQALSKGGYDKLNNIVAACYSCNRLKGSMSVDEFAARISRDVPPLP